MENNISKEFYLLCKADGITILNSKADIARMVLTAKNNGFNYSETELKEMFEEGKSLLKEEQEIIRNEKKQEKIAELRSIELKHIEEIKVISKYIGTEKPISVLQKQISELQQELYSYSKQEKDAQELGLALYKAGEMKEKDWAIHGGIASGLAGGAAGLATALDIQQQNAQAREHNKQLMSSVVRMQMGATSGIYEAKERINERISKLRNEIEAHKKRLVEELQSRDLLIKLNPQVKCQKYTETGAIELKIETQPTPNIKIYDEITAVVDGSFKALLIDNEEIVGEVLFALPDSGATKKNELIGYCVDTENFNSKVFEIVFLPINLWAIETNDEILNQDSDVELSSDHANLMLYYSAKDILRKSDKGIKEYEDALWLLECIPDFEKAKVLANDCKTKIEEIKEKEEAERIEQEKRAQAEKEEKARIAKRNTKITLVALSTTAIIAILIVVINTVILPTYRKNAFIEKYGQGVYEKFGYFEKGTYISFGGYEQDNDFANGKEEIEWLVLEEEENKIFVISKYVLDKKSYNDTSEDITWETSTIREWLNDEFVNSAFNDEEKSMICTTTVSADDNPRFQTYPGKETSDKVFLLSIDECNKYLPWTKGVDVGACSPTEYVLGQGVSVSDEYKLEGRSTCRWWLRTPGYRQHKGAYVTYFGGVWDEGCDAVGEQRFLNGTVYGVRPAMWIELK